jgi:large subunit ribosomal protein L6
MSKVGMQVIGIPSDVSVNIDGIVISVKGGKGELTKSFPNTDITFLNDGSSIKLERKNDGNQTKACHGLYRALLANMVEGVSKGVSKKLELIGVGYKAKKQGNGLVLNLGYSHPIEMKEISGISFTLEKDTKISIDGIDKALVGQVAANIRKMRPPEPYKGKGVRYAGEVIKLKAGKAGKGK